MIISSIWYLELLLYNQEFANISLYVLFCSGFLIKSPRFLTEIISPLSILKLSDTCTNWDNTPVSLNSTFLVRSPSSYP